jgi:hypothetical protein
MLMEVDLCETDWRESGERRRAWVSFDEAKRLLDRPKLIELLHAAMVQLKSAPGDSPARAAIRA